MKKILFLHDKEKHLAEHIDAALACAVMGLEVGITLPYSAIKPGTSNEGDSTLHEKLKMLPLYGVKDVFFECGAETPKTTESNPTDIIKQAKLVTPSELHHLLPLYDHTIRL